MPRGTAARSPAKTRRSPAIAKPELPDDCSQVQPLAAKDQPGRPEQERAVTGSIKAGQRARAPRNQVLMERDALTNIEPFEMRDQEVQGIRDAPDGLGLAQGNISQMSPDKQ